MVISAISVIYVAQQYLSIHTPEIKIRIVRLTTCHDRDRRGLGKHLSLLRRNIFHIQGGIVYLLNIEVHDACFETLT